MFNCGRSVIKDDTEHIGTGFPCRRLGEGIANYIHGIYVILHHSSQRLRGNFALPGGSADIFKIDNVPVRGAPRMDCTVIDHRRVYPEKRDDFNIHRVWICCVLGPGERSVRYGQHIFRTDTVAGVGAVYNPGVGCAVFKVAVIIVNGKGGI